MIDFSFCIQVYYQTQNGMNTSFILCFNEFYKKKKTSIKLEIIREQKFEKILETLNLIELLIQNK